MTQRTALLLPGGGARNAYQVGALRAIAEHCPRNPFDILVGTSAGALNLGVLASRADDFGAAVEQLQRIWGELEVAQVYSAKSVSSLRSAAGWMWGMVRGHQSADSQRILDNSPLGALIDAEVDFAAINRFIDSRRLHAVAVHAARFEDGCSVSFFNSNHDVAPWSRPSRTGQKTELRREHLLASAAIPMVFAPQQIDGWHYLDGAFGQVAPLSSALHLGADKLLVITVNPRVDSTPAVPRDPVAALQLPTIASQLFAAQLDERLDGDLDRMRRVNGLLDANASDALQLPGGSHLRRTQSLVIRPTSALASAQDYMEGFPEGMQWLLNMVGQSGGFVSYILFYGPYAKALMEQGYCDAIARIDEIVSFLE